MDKGVPIEENGLFTLGIYRWALRNGSPAPVIFDGPVQGLVGLREGSPCEGWAFLPTAQENGPILSKSLVGSSRARNR